jgi:phosphoglycolate phosphatase
VSTDFQLLIFDWDGTLMDSAARIVASMQTAARSVGIESPNGAAIRDIIGLGLHEALQQLYPGSDAAFAERLVQAYRQDYLYSAREQARLFAGADGVLETLLEQGYWLAIATGKSRTGLRQVLDHCGLGKLFYSTRTADETASKPDPQMLHEILEELDVPAKQALMIGDTTYDLEMASRAGVPALAVSYGVHALDRLLACAPLGHIDDIAQLPTWLQSARSR